MRSPAVSINTSGPEHTVSRPQASAPSPAREPAYQILLVDDSPIVGERLTALINQLHRSIRVVVAADGIQALSLFGQLQPEAVVLDLELPGVSGFDLLTQFKRRRPGCVVIVLTTYAYPEFRDNALRLGADYFFAKAMEFERVTEVLSALVASPRGQPVKSKPEEKKP
jgi:DNA-binding NarL/FixJ family response regulator